LGRGAAGEGEEEELSNALKKNVARIMPRLSIRGSKTTEEGSSEKKEVASPIVARHED